MLLDKKAMDKEMHENLRNLITHYIKYPMHVKYRNFRSDVGQYTFFGDKRYDMTDQKVTSLWGKNNQTIIYIDEVIALLKSVADEAAGNIIEELDNGIGNLSIAQSVYMKEGENNAIT